MKKCASCKEIKEISDFNKDSKRLDGKDPYCKLCKKEKTNKWYLKNRDAQLIKAKEYNDNNKDNHKKYRESNKEKIKKYLSENIDMRRIARKIWLEKNKENVIEYNKKIREKRLRDRKVRKAKDPIYKLKLNIRNRVSKIFKSTGLKKDKRTYKLLGCSYEFAKEYIESKFLDGMNWGNYGVFGWHIDHIIPLASAKDEEDLLKLVHYSNMQPLWAKDNLKKGDKILTQIAA